MGLAQGLGSAAPPLWPLAGTALGYPGFALCHGDSAVLDLEVHPFRVLQQFIEEVNVGVGQLLALLLGLGSSWVGEHDSFPSSSLPGQALQHCLAQVSSPNAAYKEKGPVLLILGPQIRVFCVSSTPALLILLLF